MKVLVIGGSGVIGSKIVKHFMEKNIEVEFTQYVNHVPYSKEHFLDITQKDQVFDLVTKINPDVVIHTSALTNIDLCETNNVLADSINVNGTLNIIEGCKSTKSKLVYISTSFVFDGRKNQYFEEDQTSPSTYYGITKHRGEVMVQKSGLTYLILRTDQPYCWVEKWQHTNSVLRVIERLKSQKILKEITDWYNTPTYVPDFVQAAERLIGDNDKGIFHLVGSDFINRYEWSLIVAEMFRLDKTLIMPINSEILDLAVKRVNVNLSNQKLLLKKNIRMSGIKEGLKKMLDIMPTEFY